MTKKEQINNHKRAIELYETEEALLIERQNEITSLKSEHIKSLERLEASPMIKKVKKIGLTPFEKGKALAKLIK